ncbi:hypothetical protein L7F22_041083 [Adiantum nelumboides]|nr:hypothetical protein [Adiantum nelumboides]
MAAVGATTSCSLASSPQVLSRSKVRGRTKSRSRYRWVQLRARLQDKAEKEWESGQIVDVAVIGAGIGGLCCAAMLAKYGLKVVVCESHDTAGGAAHSFVRQGFHFDSGPSFHAGLSTKPSINPLKQAFESANADFHARSSLRRLSQTGSLAAYIIEFQRLTLEIETLSPSDKLHSFIDGLEPNLKDDVHKFDPATLDAAIAYVERLGDNRRQGRNFFPGERSFNNNRSFQRDNRGRYSQNQQRSSQNYQPARQFSSGQFFGNQSSGQQSFRPRFSGQATPSQTGSSSNGFRNRGRPRQDRRRNDRRNFQRETTSGQHASTSSAPSTSQSSRSGLCTICGGNHRWYECPKRPNPSTTRRNTNMESCPETEQCSTSTPDKGKQAVRAVRVSKVVSALMLNANTNVSVPVNLSNQVLSLLEFVGNHPLNVLVDSGCSTNFVSTMLVSKLRLPTQQSVEAFQVELADGSYLQCNSGSYLQCNKKSWLYQYDPIISFRDHSIRLFHRNQEVELRGLFNTQPITMVSAMQVKRLVRKRDCTTALVMLREAEDDTEVQSEASITDTDYLQKPFFQFMIRNSWQLCMLIELGSIIFLARFSCSNRSSVFDLHFHLASYEFSSRKMG